MKSVLYVYSGLLAVVAAVLIVYTRGTTEEQLYDAVLATDILGSGPTDARTMLESLALPDGRRLQVGSMRGDTLLIAVLPKAYWRVYHWNLHVEVAFRGDEGATAVRIRRSAESPL